MRTKIKTYNIANLPFLIAAMFLSLFLLSSWQGYQQRVERIYERAYTQLEQSAWNMSRIIEYNLAEGNVVQVQREIANFFLQDNVEFGALLNSDHTIMHASDYGWKGQYANNVIANFSAYKVEQITTENQLVILNHQNVMTAIVSMIDVDDGQKIRSHKIKLLVLQINLERELNYVWSSVFAEAIPTIIVILLFGLFLIWVIKNWVVLPLHTLGSLTQQLRQGRSNLSNPFTGDTIQTQLAQRLVDSANHIEEQFFELQEKEQRLNVTLHSIGDGVIVTDKKGNITRLNPVAETLTGWTLQQALGKSVKTIFPIIDASTREPIKNPVEKVLETGETVYLSNHTTLIAKDGAEYQIADSASPIRDGNNEILGMVLIFNDVTEQYRLRQLALQAQQQIEKLFNDMQTMVAVLDDDCNVIFANMTPLKLSGLVLSDVTGKKLWDCVWFAYDRSLQMAVETDCQSVISSKVSLLRDFQIETINGLLWVEVTLHPILDDKGNITQLVVEGRDISQRKEMEEEIHSTMQHLKLYREQTPLAAIEWNTDFQVLNWNEAASEMFGYPLEEVKGRNFVDIMLPDSAVVDVKQIWQDLIAQTGGTVSVNENLTKDGQIILCEWHNTPLINENGDVIGAASLVLDITRERSALLALEKKEQEQSEILNTLSDGVITINGGGIILSYNRAATTLFGFNYDEVVGENISMLMPEPDKGHHDGYLDNYIQSSRKQCLIGSREVIGQHKNKSTFPMRLTVAELPRAEDGTHRFIGSCQDLTHIKSQQAQLQRTQKMDALGKLVGGISHDYNNMLGVIIGYTGLIEMKFSDVKGLQKYIDNINQASERGRQLTKRMLAFSKQESTEAKAVDLHHILAEQKELFSKSVTALIQLDYQLCESPWPIWVDPSELEDSLLNLVINAQYAMPRGGSLTFTSQAIHLAQSEADLLGLSANDYMKLSITDTGHGIDNVIINNIFDPFFSTKGTDGTGLGLSQVYGFMERAGGMVRVYSQKEIGTEFVLYFPRYKGDSSISDESKEKISSARQGDGETILVVDDEPALRELAQEILSLSGYYVLTASDGENAKDILAENTIDLVLSDVIMPHLDGYQLASYIQEQYPNIKIQLASGFSDNRHLVATNETLHKTMLHKPYSSSELLARIATLLQDENND